METARPSVVLKTAHLRRAESGQAAVETAIIMPLFVFMMLGLFQLMLMHQARLLTKYAAYKAVRAGSLHQGDVQMMRNAAMSVVLPVAASIDSNYDRVYPTRTDAQYVAALTDYRNQYAVPGAHPVVDVTICGPLQGYLGGNATVEFDDPNTTGPAYAGGMGWSGSEIDRSKLAIQVTFYYRMIIPFVNGVLWWMVYGKENPGLLKVLRTGQKDRQTLLGPGSDTFRMYNPRADGSKARMIEDVLGLAEQKKYIMPITASYVMRMQSTLTRQKLPVRNFCTIPWKKTDE